MTILKYNFLKITCLFILPQNCNLFDDTDYPLEVEDCLSLVFRSSVRINVSASDEPIQSKDIPVFFFFLGCAGPSLLCGLFSSYGEQGALSSRNSRVSHCGGFLLQNRALVLGCKFFRSCSSQVLEHRLSS